MTGFKISKIIADEKYPVCMLIEQGIICYIASFNDDVTLTSFKQGDLCAGLVQCKLNDPCEMSLSKNKKFVLVSNKQTIEIYIANENQNRTNIILDLVLIVNYDSLPLLIDSIHDFRFSNSDNNVFYAIGRHNPEFYEQAVDMDENSFGNTISHKIEKFYIENEAFSSETIATFEMGNEQEEVYSYCFSDSLCKVVVLSNANNLYSFMLKESVEKINVLKGTSIKENICMIKWYFNDTFLAVLTTKNKVLILDTHLRLYSMSVLCMYCITKEFKPISQFIDLQTSPQQTYDQKRKEYKKQVKQGKEGSSLGSKRVSVDIHQELVRDFLDDDEEEKRNKQDSKTKLPNTSGLIPSRDDNNMFKFFGNNNYQIISQLEENFNPVNEDENLKILNFSNPTIVVYNENVVRIYRFEVGLQHSVSDEIPQTIDDVFVIKVLKSKGNHRHMLRYLSSCIYDPESLLISCVLFMNEILRKGVLLSSYKIHVNDLLKLYKICRDSTEYQYFFHTIEFYFLKIGIKYLTIGLYEPSIKIALEMKSTQLLSTISMFAKAQKNASILGLVNYIKEQWNPGSSNSSLVKAMEQIANFSKKQLKKEDLGNIYKDFETLLRIDDINDLELSDFNSWEINLDAYQTALNFELDGKYDEAKKLYKENNLTSDMTRVDNIQKQINKEMAEREKNIYFCELKNLKQ